MSLIWGKGNCKARAFLLCKHQVVIFFFCRDLLSVTTLSNSYLEGEETEDKGSLETITLFIPH